MRCVLAIFIGSQHLWCRVPTVPTKTRLESSPKKFKPCLVLQVRTLHQIRHPRTQRLHHHTERHNHTHTVRYRSTEHTACCGWHTFAAHALVAHVTRAHSPSQDPRSLVRCPPPTPTPVRACVSPTPNRVQDFRRVHLQNGTERTDCTELAPGAAARARRLRLWVCRPQAAR